ncbi:MAG: VWA domain-containing protein [Candidatus Cloacimonetes bacterium]|nr:VWA domain-containing protein [Candidatus Cloacimonadota bacterium]
MSRILLLVIAVIVAVLFFVPLWAFSDRNLEDVPQIPEEIAKEDTLAAEEKIDDWVLNPEPIESESSNKKFNPQAVGSASRVKAGNPQSGIVSYTIDGMSVAQSAPHQENTIGYSVGGAKDIGNFRDNIENNYLPQLSSITYEGLFYDYYFDTGQEESSAEEMFSPSYSLASISNTRRNENELWLSVGLNSNIKESDFSRKKLNLVVVLDVSGSMDSSIRDYYYDGEPQEGDDRTKLELACETICSMLEHLNPEDRFGMVLFENQAYLAKPMNLVGKTDMKKIKQHIMELQTMGGTNMEAGMLEGTKQFDTYLQSDKSEYENRIIFLTDAMPNLDQTDKYGLWGILKENSEKGLYSTLIGVGVDFQTDLVESISKVEGANYYSVHSAADFKKRLDEEFEFMVTPLVFNLNLVLDAEGYEIVRVCGTPYSAESSGEILKVGTLFPSASEDGEVRGGIILVQLRRTKQEGTINLIAGYDDRQGKHHSSRKKVDMRKYLLSSTINSGIKKGVLLVHYADLLKEWVSEMRGMPAASEDDWQFQQKVPGRRRDLNEWEQTSMPLEVSAKYREEFIKFKDMLNHEIKVLGDEKLKQEVKLLDKLITVGNREKIENGG